MAWTTTELLADIRRLAMLPTSTVTATADADLLAHADYELQNYITSLMLRVCEEYLVRVVDIPLTAGVSRYAIPRRSVGSRVRSVDYLKGGGLTHIPRLKPEQVDSALATQQGFPFGFYLESASLVLLPAPAAADALRVRYYVRPASLAAVGSGLFAAITSVTPDSPSPGRTTLGFASSSMPSVVDVVSGKQPFESLAVDAAAANVTSTSLDVATSTLTTTPAAGDYVCVPDAAPVVQAPLEMFGLLTQRAAARALQSLGYMEEANAAWQAAASRETDTLAILTPRTDGNPKRLSGGFLSQMGRGSARWGW